MSRLAGGALVTLIASVPAFAQGTAGDQPARALEVAVGVGYGNPLGGYGQTTAFPTSMSLGYWITGQVPISLDLGYRINRRFVIGVSGQYGFGFVNEQHTFPCNGEASCSAPIVRVGVGVIWNVLPSARVAPWIGLGAGYEWATIKQSSPLVNDTSTVRGPEYANLRAGADFTVAPGLSVGPFFSLSFGRYESATFSGDLPGPAPAFTMTQIHEWLVVGARGTYDLGL